MRYVLPVFVDRLHSHQVPLETVQQAVYVVDENLTADGPEATKTHAKNTKAYVKQQSDPRFKQIQIKA